MTSWSLVSIVLVQMESLPRLGPVVSTMGSYMKYLENILKYFDENILQKYQKDMQRGRELPSISWLTKKALSPAFWTLSLASWMKNPFSLPVVWSFRGNRPPSTALFLSHSSSSTLSLKIF